MTGEDWSSEQAGDPTASFGSPPPLARSGRRVLFGSVDMVQTMAGYWSADELDELSRLLEKAAKRRRKSGGKAKRRARKRGAALLGDLAGLLGAAQVQAQAREDALVVQIPYQVSATPDGPPLEVTLADGTVTTNVPPGATFTVPLDGSGSVLYSTWGQPGVGTRSAAVVSAGPGDQLQAPTIELT